MVNNIKVLVVRAEDARILRNMKALKKQYARLSQENNALVAEFNQRNSNHTELLRCLKELNAFIQKGSNLRGRRKCNISGKCKERNSASVPRSHQEEPKTQNNRYC